VEPASYLAASPVSGGVFGCAGAVAGVARALGRVPDNDIKTATATVDPKIEEYANWQEGCRKLAARFLDGLAFQTLARRYFCRTKPKGTSISRRQSLRELASGTWLATNNSSMAAMSRAGSTAMSRFARSFRSSEVEKAGKAP